MGQPNIVAEKIIKNIETVILGKTSQIQLILSTWIGGGHVLLEDVPGTGKTVLAKCFAKSVNTSLGRIQFTPDLLPSDVIGTTIVDQETKKFYFRKGPVFSTFLLADEINRATPRTQSALLECMGEGQVTVEGKTAELSNNFFVMATQNPLEHHGTFPLPEAQLDRFAVRISMGYPNTKDEIKLIKDQNKIHPIADLKSVASESDINDLKGMVSKIKVHDKIYEYVMNIVTETRRNKDVNLGASPRASISLIKLGQALSLVMGHDYVLPTIVHNLVLPVLGHRIQLSNEAKFSGLTVEQVLENILNRVETPTL